MMTGLLTSSARLRRPPDGNARGVELCYDWIIICLKSDQIMICSKSGDIIINLKTKACQAEMPF